MSITLSEITGFSNGAQFRRADLHIHSFGQDGSYDVFDQNMTPENIVETAIKENLHVISITDHNRIGNIRRALKQAENRELLIVPGVELSTPHGHLLVYFPTVEKLENFYGKLNISDDKKACHDTMAQCLKQAEAYDGFGICAHIEIETGLEGAHPKFDTFKQDILNSKNLLALEIKNLENKDWFSLADTHPERKNCARLRRESLGLEEEIDLPKIMSSDSHTLESLGRNAVGNRRLTRVKMESLTFDSLRIAFLDSAARVRLEELLPNSIPRFIGMKMEGGFLKNQIIHFSRNLTCIIGGRGAGKSTTLESLRVASGNNMTDSKLVDSEVWPDEISLLYEDEAGQIHTLSRSKLNSVINPLENGPTTISIESYGQGETAETIQHCGKDPSILLKFLDGFVHLSEMQQEDAVLRDQLLVNQTEIEKLQREIVRIPEIAKAKAIADAEVSALKSQDASAVVELEEKLAKERLFREQLKSDLSALLISINNCLSGEDLRNSLIGQDGNSLAVGEEEFIKVKTLVEGLANDIETIATQLKLKVTDTGKLIGSELKNWAQKEKVTQEKIEEIRRELEKQNIKLDMAYIRKVTKDASDFASKLIDLQKCVPLQKDLFRDRRLLITKRIELHAKLFTTRAAFATVMNANLESTVIDYKVTIRFKEGLLSEVFENLLKSSMGWRTSQVPKANILASALSPLDLLDAITKNDSGRIVLIKDGNGKSVFNQPEAEEILLKMGEWESKTALERCEFDDRPEIIVAREVIATDGTKSFSKRDFSLLSLGQQQSILLSVLLFSKSKSPLIIDQPEDNLDSEFIYKTLVRSLRSIKEHRQVIIVTHNANIAVLGDAELIVPLRGASDFSIIRSRGSIDTLDTKEIVCTILEGSKKAFKRRQEVYGY